MGFRNSGLFLNVPFISFIFVKSFMNRAFSWDAIIATGGHIFTLPNWETIAATTFIYSGYANMAFFNRVFFKPVETKTIWLLGILGLSVLMTTFFIPIGFQGSEGVGDYTYPWVSTSDSIRIELGFVERVMFVFLILYAGISTISISVHWYSALEFFKSFVPKRKKFGTYIMYGVYALLGAVALRMGATMDQDSIFRFGRFWLSVRLGGEFVLVGIVYFAAKRSQHEKNSM